MCVLSVSENPCFNRARFRRTRSSPQNGLVLITIHLKNSLCNLFGDLVTKRQAEAQQQCIEAQAELSTKLVALEHAVASQAEEA